MGRYVDKSSLSRLRRWLVSGMPAGREDEVGRLRRWRRKAVRGRFRVDAFALFLQYRLRCFVLEEFSVLVLRPTSLSGVATSASDVRALVHLSLPAGVAAFRFVSASDESIVVF